MAEKNKGGEAQSLQTPSISYVNSNGKDKDNLPINQTIAEFSYWQGGTRSIDSGMIPTKTVTLTDVHEYVQNDSGQGKDGYAKVKFHGRFRKTSELSIIRTSGLMHFEIKCLPQDVVRLKMELIGLNEIDVLIYSITSNDGLIVVVPSGDAFDGEITTGRYKDTYANVFNMYLITLFTK